MVELKPLGPHFRSKEGGNMEGKKMGPSQMNQLFKHFRRSPISTSPYILFIGYTLVTRSFSSMQGKVGKCSLSFQVAMHAA